MSLRQISTIQNMPILDLETGEVLGRVVNWVIKTKEQRLAAFLLDKTSPFKSPQVIVPADIIEYGPNMIVARDRASIVSPKEIVGLPELISKKYVLVGFKAETENGTKLGHIEDFTFDTISSEVRTYYIGPGGAVGIFGNSRIIPSEQVIRIQSGKVIFTNDVIKPKTESAKKQVATYRV
ncbi:hypothetical protein DRH29_01235 [candidate division Kazan bacterium]|uniref:PRC-barrel domain-containing protein n=1 Tax=candidate division Kazan bacterium TaxID=2202143 RepID=A0A420ZDC5_UNCK3|nr:MAG: hypothetical protein DRH29_01235 [candidate division Kazan bacterium]